MPKSPPREQLNGNPFNLYRHCLEHPDASLLPPFFLAPSHCVHHGSRSGFVLQSVPPAPLHKNNLAWSHTTWDPGDLPVASLVKTPPFSSVPGQETDWLSIAGGHLQRTTLVHLPLRPLQLTFSIVTPSTMPEHGQLKRPCPLLSL